MCIFKLEKVRNEPLVHPRKYFFLCCVSSWYDEFHHSYAPRWKGTSISTAEFSTNHHHHDHPLLLLLLLLILLLLLLLLFLLLLLLLLFLFLLLNLLLLLR